MSSIQNNGENKLNDIPIMIGFSKYRYWEISG